MRATLAAAAVCWLSVSAFSQEARWNHPKTAPLPSDHMGPFVSTGDGAILTVDKGDALVSRDGGRTWQSTPMFPGKNIELRPERVLLRTRAGTILVVFLNQKEMRWRWNNDTRQADEAQLDVWAARSTDNGRTWTDLQRIQKGYCGAIRDIIQTKSGRVVVTAQDLVPPVPRHWTVTYSTADEGLAWSPANILDLGGSGHHDGSLEATVEQLRDGRLWLLMRTSLDYFWEAHSSDEGQRWTSFGPTKIEASAAPALVKRLRSGRLILLWNRPHPEGKKLERRPGGQAYAQPVWSHRGELSMAFSNDEGKSWSKPVAIAREAGKSLAYPYLFEPEPGVLWITTMQGGVRLRLREADFR